MTCAHIQLLSKSKQTELLSNYKTIVRYSLLYRSRHYFKITKKGTFSYIEDFSLSSGAGKELKALLQADDELFNELSIMNNEESNLSTQSANSTHRKRKALQASGMDEIINHIDKLSVASCHFCFDSLNSSRLHACLECVFIGCAKSLGAKSSHLSVHMKETGHFLAVDFNHCSLYCNQCNAYIYPDEYEQILFADQYHLDYIISRVREPFTSKPIHPLWKPSEEEAADIKLKSKAVKCTGMRGLLNLGSTCFMNSILQSLIHNPLFKAHFLSDKHSAQRCSRNKMNCMSCQLDSLFSQFFSTDTAPFSPNQCLHSMWISQTHMAGYSQQDAHEFFISFLDEVHKSSSNSQHLLKDCKCIVHQVFGGVLQSDVTCTACNAISLTRDPILDISLEIKASAFGRKKKLPGDEISLLDCLEEFTLPEKLGVGSYKCKSCGSANVEAYKQLSINTLPPVLAIQLKRFKHADNNSTKIDTFVKVPLTLDMTPLTTRSVKMKNILQQAKSKVPKVTSFDSVSDGIPSYKYSLFSVVCHQGKIDTGHYQSFCRVRDRWFLFDDHNVTSVSLHHVLKQNVYMCFYIRDHCEYFPDDNHLNESLNLNSAVDIDGDTVMT